MNQKLLERVAEYMHNAWIGWMKYMVAELTPENIARWRRQMNTPYNKLPEHEKNSDRLEARAILEIIDEQKKTEGIK